MNKVKVSECVGCGYCCMQAPCSAASRLYPMAKSCPQLEWSTKDNRYYCGLMRLGGPLAEGYKRELYAGAGCCSSLNSWRKDVKKRDTKLDHAGENPIPEIMQIFVKHISNVITSDIMVTTLIHLNESLEEKGYNEKDRDIICNNIMHIFDENRSSFMKDFMG